MKGLISICDLTEAEIYDIIELSIELKEKRLKGKFSDGLKYHSLGMIFEKPSTRTRISFEVAMTHLGGHSIYLNWHDLQLGRGETIADTARVLSGYVNVIAIRANHHASIIELQQNASIPVINALSNLEHPCQSLADLMTIYEKKGKLIGEKFAWIGDGNNVCNSSILACAIMGIDVDVACPPGYEPDKTIIEKARKMCTVRILHDPIQASENADVLYTDSWVSMGDEETYAQRMEDFSNYRVNGRLIEVAKKDVIVLHCLPAHRGQEITSDVMDGEHSAIFSQAENRLHTQKALLLKLLK
ncbi:MAG TPA: ornithine carbamoyltransferase [Candidatus Acidoferrales bacterium]|nr:ornithine carbamoyltransferase [Candidatus Acidoferrales bacterium]